MTLDKCNNLKRVIVTIVDTVISLMDLEYQLYEIIVVDNSSKDCTAEVLIDHFKMDKISRLIRKKWGKGDALNMGINAVKNPYFLCMDADSMLQRDSLENIVRPLLEDDTKYEPNAVCWSRAPTRIKDLMTQRRRWHLLCVF